MQGDFMDETQSRKFYLRQDSATRFSAHELQKMLYSGILDVGKSVYDDGRELTVGEAVLGIEMPDNSIDDIVIDEDVIDDNMGARVHVSELHNAVLDDAVSNDDDHFTVEVDVSSDVQNIREKKGNDFVGSTFADVVQGNPLSGMRVVGNFADL